jgi:phosphate acetyltransferase
VLIPATLDAGTKTISFGLLDALTNKSVRAAVLPEFDIETIEQLLTTNRTDDFLENVFEQCEIAGSNKDVVIVSGLSLAKPYAVDLNFKIATALDAAVIFVAAEGQSLQDALGQLKIIANPYQHRYQRQILGFIVNKVALPETQAIQRCKDFFALNIPLLGAIPYKNDLAEKAGSFHVGITINKYIGLNWLWPFLNNIVSRAFTPTMFRHNLISSARQANKKIVLPEGDEPRTLQAANICAARGIARCVLLGKKRAIYDACAKINLKLNEQIEIIEPQDVVEKYVEPLCEVRRRKNLTPEAARKQLGDNAVLGTMMLYLGKVDGLVSGAVHTSANTIRPALQIIKTAPAVKLASSVFFMCLPDQVLVYGDCAINPNPNAEELADIAIQSANSAASFGIMPRVAMLSYSTGDSGFGPDVNKVKAATEIVRQLRPDLEVDGPLQYDAAIDKEVAKLKAPNSSVAGRATVFVFPNLDVGNISYKTVQRSTGIVCIGPILQGLHKPVNDLSRGCTVNDIVFTIAITAVQASTH